MSKKKTFNTMKLIVLLCFGIGLCTATNLQENSFSATKTLSDVPTSGSVVAEATPEQYRASYYYGGPHPQFVNGNPEWSRDSYANAATDLGYNADSSQGHGSYYPAPSTSYGVDDGSDFDGIGGGLGGLGGLAGLLGFKGLKGLGILGILKLGILPFIFLVLPALLLLPLLLLFIPIPVVTIPQGRSIGIDIKDITGRMSTLARSVLDSDKCIERMSCEMSRYSRGTFIDKTLKRVIFKYETQMPNPLQRMARAYLEPIGCKKYTCFLLDDSNNPASKKYKKTS